MDVREARALPVLAGLPRWLEGAMFDGFLAFLWRGSEARRSAGDHPADDNESTINIAIHRGGWSG